MPKTYVRPLAVLVLLAQGLDTECPQLRLPNGTVWEGTHDEAVGTFVVLRPGPAAASTAGLAGPSQEDGASPSQRQLANGEGAGDEQAGSEAATGAGPPAANLVHLCHTDKLLLFRKPAPITDC